MKREWLTMAMTGTVAVLVLSGCGESNSKAPQSAPGAKAQAAAEAKATAMTGGLPTGAPAQRDPVRIASNQSKASTFSSARMPPGNSPYVPFMSCFSLPPWS